MPSGIYKRKSEFIKIGRKFGRLTILKEIEYYINSKGKKYRRVLCQCECGNIKEILYQSLKTETKSCGCLKIENNKNNKPNYKHGMCKTKFYNIWGGINRRCNNKNNSDYGGRGITVCKEWKFFKEFKKDMYKSYLKHCNKFGKNQTTIDRIDNNGNYYKENCRWATCEEQSNNKRSNILITYNNKALNITQWAKKLNINRNTLYTRINKNWSIKNTLNTK